MFNKGDALGYEILAHRQKWNGTVCSGAADWNCGKNQDFRETHCANGDDRCFVKNAFYSPMPSIRVLHGLTEAPDNLSRLRNQILLLWTRKAREPVGVTERAWTIAGVYRIQVAIPVGPTIWDITPYDDGWIDLSSLNLSVPTFEMLSPSYFRKVDGSRVLKLLREANEKAAHAKITESSRERIHHFLKSIESWQAQSGESASFLDECFNEKSQFGEPLKQLGAPIPGLGALAKRFNDRWNEKLAQPAKAEPSKSAATTASRESPKHNSSEKDPAPEEPKNSGAISHARSEVISNRYGTEIARKLQIGLLTKPILILKGDPGAGKSELATCLAEDEKGTIIVPVVSSWRGSEDLLGYVNPVTGKFEATAFSRFLIEAEEAWDRGDRRLRVAIFEEFNLSPPEFWLSEILVRSQYLGDRREDRTILFGAPVRDGSDSRKSVFLSPALRFVATMNSDHTTKPLSPRVLDRASIVTLRMDPKRALQQAGLTLEEDQLEAIEDLNHVSKQRGGSFSIRSALSLATCFKHQNLLGLPQWRVIDHVLTQEVLGKIQLLAGDPGDSLVLDSLVQWSEGYGEKLPLCAAQIRDYKSTLESGADVRP